MHSKANIVYATFSTWVTPTVAINRGEIWAADDPVVLSHPDWFTDDPSSLVRRSSGSVGEPITSTAQEDAATGRPPVETATAAPGERRTRR